MGIGNKNYPIDDSTGATAFLAKANRVEVILRNIGPDRVWLAFNEAAVELEGMYLDIGDVVVFNGLKADAAIYGVCATGETAELGAQITL